MAKQKETGTINKGVHFNLDKPLEKALYRYVTGDTVTNYSSFMKSLIYNHMQQNGGIEPYQVIEPSFETEPVQVKVAPAKVTHRRVVEDIPEEDYNEPVIDNEPEEDEQMPEEELPKPSNKLANFGGMSARQRREAQKNR